MEFFIGAIVDTPDGIGEVVDYDEEGGILTVCLERTEEEVEYSDFECDLLDNPQDDDIDDDEDLMDEDYDGDPVGFDEEFGDDEDEE